MLIKGFNFSYEIYDFFLKMISDRFYHYILECYEWWNENIYK